MKILRVTYFNYEEPFISEEHEAENVGYDDQTRCLVIDRLNNDGNKELLSFPVANLRNFSITSLEREM